MCLLQIELAHVPAGVPGTGYGILLAPSAEKEQSVYFGMSLEWCRGTEHHGMARFKPKSVRWKEQRWKIEAGQEPEMDLKDNPEEFIRDFHNATLHKVLPNLLPKIGKPTETLPAAGLLVRFVSHIDDRKPPEFDWVRMKRVVQEERQKFVDKIMAKNIEGDNEDGEVSDGWSSALHSDFVAPDIFRASSAPPTEMVVVDEPFWLASVLHRWYRLHDFESVVLMQGPVFPVLSPLVLEAALTMPSTGLKDLPFDAYRAMGSKVLGLLAAVTSHARMPDGHHKQILQKMVDMFPRDRLASLMRKSFPMDMLASAISQLGVRLWAPPGTQCHPLQEPIVSKSPNNEDLANIAEALVGAYFLSEGSFFSAWQFMLWLTHQDASEEAPKPWEKAVLGHLLLGSGKPFRGHTPSYLELQEIVDGGESILRVQYSDKDQPPWIEYRRSGPNRKFPEERREFGTDKWESLVFVQKHMTFVSLCPSLCLKKHLEVPNKVCGWLLGKSLASLVKLKAYSVKKDTSGRSQTEFLETPAYSQLQEKITGELLVRYRHHGVFVYKRSDDGNLGIEQEVEASRTSKRSLGPSGLIYSEISKTLKSSILKKPLPNKVTEWTHQHRCLAFIVTPKKTDFQAGRVIDEKSEVKIKDEGLAVTWWYKDDHTSRAFECSVDIKPHGPGGVVLMEREITDSRMSQEKEELIYSEEMKTWLSPALTKTLERQKQWTQGVPVPSMVLDWLKQNVQKALREPINLISSFRTQYFKVPWSSAPHFVKTMLPRKIDLALWEAEVLKYTFSNSMLLVEALTHASYGKANTPPNTRLATLGRWLVEATLTLAVTQRTAFPMHATRVAEEDVEGKEASQTFAVSALHVGSEYELYDGLKWPRIPSGTEANQWLTEGLRSKDGAGSERMLTDSDRLLEWVNLSCNHVTYAYICCQKGMHKHILHSSEELESHMEDFAKVAHHASDKPGVLWLTLSVHDAPRVLSDTLLAVAAAVFLDSDWTTFHRLFDSLFKDHLMPKMFTDEMTGADGGPVDSGDPVAHLRRLADSEGLALAVCRVPAPVAEDTHNSPCLWTSIVKAYADDEGMQKLDPFRGRAFDPSALPLFSSPPHLMEPAQKDQDPIYLETKDRQCLIAGTLRDFNFCSLSLGGIAVGPPIGAASPRSAARRCASLAAPGLTA
jgi:dsRNA-specific ribonuclease